MKEILIKNIVLEGERADILVSGSRIGRIAPYIEAPGAEILDGKGMTAMPGFINMHTHAAMTLTRSIAEDMPLRYWLPLIWSYEDYLDEEMIYWGTKLAALEMIKTGTTTYLDQYWMHEVSAKASTEMGLRSFLTHVILDRRDISQMSRTKEACLASLEHSRKWENELSRFHLAFHAPYTVSDEIMAWTAQLARDNGKLLHIHLSETRSECLQCEDECGRSPVKHLDDLGVFGDNVVAAHCVWLDEEDIDILGRNKVNVVYNINSNLKLSSGYRFRYNALRNAGANVCLGTDGCASSNNLDMLEATKTCALVQKAWREDPKAMPIEEVLQLSTVNGAKALGLEAGVIAEGMLADIVLVRTDSYEFVPNFNFKANYIYSAHSDCIDTVICNGCVLMRGREVEGEEEILRNALKQAERLYNLKNQNLK